MKKCITKKLTYGITAFLIAACVSYALHAEPLQYRRLVSLKAQQDKDGNKNGWNTVWCHSNNPWWRAQWESFGDLRLLYVLDVLVGDNGPRASNGGELMMILKAGDPEFTGEIKAGDPVNLVFMATRRGEWEDTNLGFGIRWYVHPDKHSWFSDRSHILAIACPDWAAGSKGDVFSLASPASGKNFGEVLDTNDVININHPQGALSVIRHGAISDRGTIAVGGSVSPSTSNNFSFSLLTGPNGANNNAFSGAEAFSDSPNVSKKLYTGSIVKIKRPNGKYIRTAGTSLNGNETNPGNIETQFRLYIHSSGLFGLESVANPGSFLSVDPKQVTYMHNSNYNWGKARKEDTERRMEGNVTLKKLTSDEIANFKTRDDREILWFIKGTLNEAFITNVASNALMRGEDSRVAIGAGFSFGPNDRSAGEVRLSIEVFQGAESPTTLARKQAEDAQAKVKAETEATQVAATKQIALSFANQIAKTETGQPRTFALVTNENKYLKVVLENKQPLLKTKVATLDNLKNQGFMFTAQVYDDGSIGLVSKLTNKLLQAADLNANSSDGFILANGATATPFTSWTLTRPADSTSLDRLSLKNKGNQGYLSTDSSSDKVSTGVFGAPIDYVKNGTAQPISSLSQFRIVDISPFTEQLTEALNKPSLAKTIQIMTTLMGSATTNAEKKMYIKEIEGIVNRRTPDTLPALKALLNNLIFNTPATFTKHDIIDPQTGKVRSQVATKDYINYAKEIMQFIDVTKTKSLSISNKKGKVGILSDESMQFVQAGTGVISCKVKATDSVAFTFSTRKNITTINEATYVIYLGINNNTQTVLMKHGKPIKTYTAKEALLKADGSFHTYWIVIENGSISCGIDTAIGQNPSITWKDPATTPGAVKFVGFSCNESPIEIQEITFHKSLTDLQLQEMTNSDSVSSPGSDQAKPEQNISINEQIARLRNTIYGAAETAPRRRLFVEGLDALVNQGWKMTPEQKAEIKEFIKQVQFMREFSQDSAPFSTTENVTLYQKLAQLTTSLAKEYSYVEKIGFIRKTLEEEILTLAKDNPTRATFFNEKLGAFLNEKEPKTTDEINLIKDDILLFLKYGRDKELSESEISKVDALLNQVNGIKGTPTAQALESTLTLKQLVQDYRKKIDEVLALPQTDSKRLALLDTELGKFISERKEKTAESRTILTNEVLMYAKYGKPGSLTDAENKAIDKHLASLTKEAEDLAKLVESFSYKVTQAKEKLESTVLLAGDNPERMKFFDGELGKLIADRTTKTAEDRTLIKDNILLYAKYGKAAQLTEAEKLVIEKHLDTLKKEEGTPVANTVAQPVQGTVPQYTQPSNIYVPRTASPRPGMGSVSGIRRPQLRRRS